MYQHKPEILKRYFINDVICRVATVPGFGNVVDIGLVEYPSISTKTIVNRNTNTTITKVQTHQELVNTIKHGFTGDFYVTWGHNSHVLIGVGRKGFKRQLVSAQDDSIFLLDRQLVPGMFVKKGTDESIGIVKAVDVSLAASLESEMPGGQVMNDIEARLLEWDWQAESVLESHFMTNGWIGQVVELQRSAQLAMELDSQFEIKWTESLADDKVQKVLGDEIHNRFSSVGDFVKMSFAELSKVKWISNPEGKGLVWPIKRCFEYSGQLATVEHIFTNAIRFKWLEKLLTPTDTTSSVPPREWISAEEFGSFLRSKQLQSLKLPLPETKRVADCIALFNNSPNSNLHILTYERWANSHLYEKKVQSSLSQLNSTEEPPEKRCKVDPISPQMHERLLSPYVPIGSENKLIRGRIISKSSRVAVEWSPLNIESLSSTDVKPIFLDRSIGYQPGTIVRRRIENSCVVQREESAYGIVVRSHIQLQTGRAPFVTVNYFKIPFETNVPVLDAVLTLDITDVMPHWIYNYRPGSILVRSNPYDEFVAGIFLGASETGELITACPGGIVKVWPNRVIQLNKKSEFNISKKKKTDEDWIVVKGHRNNGFSLPMDLTNLNPSSSSFAFHVHKGFADNEVKIWEGEYTHHFALMDDIASETQTLADDHSTEQFLQQELAIAEILPEGIWIKCTKSKKNLYFAAIEGPVGTVYEDSVLFFEFALPQTWMSFRGDSHIYFDSYYKEQINAELFLDGRVCFAENITTDSTDMTGSWEVKLPKTRFPSPSLAATLLTIRESSLRGNPIWTKKFRGLVGSLPFTSKESEERSIHLNALAEVASSIINQLQNYPAVWRPELLSYYKVHVPKFCARVVRWVTEQSLPAEAPNFPLLPIADSNKKTELLDKVQELIEVYSQMF